MRIEVLTNDVVKLRIIYESTMLLMEEHKLRRCRSLHVRQIDMDEHEDDEHEHEVVVDDAHRHSATGKDQSRT